MDVSKHANHQMSKLTLYGVHQLARRAMAGGGRMLGPTEFLWNVSGRCEAPVTRTFESGPYRGMSTEQWDPRSFSTGRRPRWRGKVSFKPKIVHGMTVHLETKCRRCRRCLKEKRAMWSARARAETLYSSRTWFGTLTLSADKHLLMINRARAKCARNGDDFDLLSEGARYSAEHREIISELTKYLKRIRKASKCQLRYLLVGEAHKTGLPHYHMLVHERLDGGTIGKRTLDEQWPWGFCKWRLVSTLEEASYVTKYLTKSDLARVRASIAYGNPSHLAYDRATEKSVA